MRGTRVELATAGYLEGFLSSDDLITPDEYRKLRRTLIKYFGWKGASRPEELADEVVVRVLRRLAEGVEIHEGLTAFSRGVARNVLLELGRRPSEVELPQGSTSSPSPPYELTAVESKILLNQRLQAIGPDDRVLLLEYYTLDRAEVAAKHGLSAGALRTRVHRIVSRMRSFDG